MKLFVLTANVLIEETAIVVEAPNEKRAREIAVNQVFGDKSKKIYASAELSNCQELRLTGKSHVVHTVIDEDPYR